MFAKDSPKIAIVGSGAVGGYVGARLAHAGQDVHFLARSDYEILGDKGWIIEVEGEGEMHVSEPSVHLSTESIGKVDLVIVALKSWQNEALEALLVPLLGDDTVIMTLQNGFGNQELISAQFPNQRVVVGMCHFGVSRSAPGRILKHAPSSDLIRIGELSPSNVERLETLRAMIDRSGIRTEISTRLEEAMWRKLMWNVPYNGLAVISGGIPVNEITGDSRLCEIVRALMEELRMAATARGFPIEPEFTEKLMRSTEKIGNFRPSSLVDFDRDQPMEIEAIWGEPLRRGRASGVEMPHLSVVHAVLQRLNRRNLRSN